MTSRTPSYITKNRLGIYLFQYAIPAIVINNGDRLGKKLIRKSLRTRDRKVALRIARIYWLIMDKIWKKYFGSREQEARAKLLMDTFYSLPENDYDAYDTFLANLDESNESLLNKAIAMQAEENAIRNVSNERISELQLLVATYANGGHTTSQPAYSAEEDPKLSVLIDLWLSSKVESKLKNSSIESLRSRIKIFLGMIVELEGIEPTISRLSVATIRKFCDVIKTFPVRRNAKVLAGKSLLELSKLGLPPISDKTHEEYMNTSADFLNWLKGDAYPVDHRLADILLSKKVKKDKQETTKKLPFSDTDVVLIFSSDSYCKGTMKRASDYWVPLIALFSGARRGEICQLTLDDIYKKGNDWVFDINEDFDDDDEDTGKSIKSSSGSKRLVPIHPILKELGLLEYRSFLIKYGETRLFPNEERNSQGRFDAFSKRFSHQKSIKVIQKTLKENEQKSFHSFRHTVRTKLVDISPNETSVIDSIVGHEKQNKEKSEGDKTYTHTEIVPHKVKLLKKLSYPIDFTKLSKWDSCVFAREIRIKKKPARNTKPS